LRDDTYISEEERAMCGNFQVPLRGSYENLRENQVSTPSLKKKINFSLTTPGERIWGVEV